MLFRSKLPEKVTLNCDNGAHVVVKGDKGSLEWDLPTGISLEEKDGEITLTRSSEHRTQKALHGTSRALIANMVEGVSTGFVKELEIHGVGFRAAVKGKQIDLNLGYSHPVLHDIPEGLTVTVDENTKIKIEGIDKQEVGQLAAEIRNYYKPEPYKGKGVRYKGEHIRRKEGKSVK